MSDRLRAQERRAAVWLFITGFFASLFAGLFVGLAHFFMAASAQSLSVISFGGFY